MFRLFGPVLPFELTRTARRGRLHLLRALYAAALLALVVFAHLDHAPGWASEREMSTFAETLFGRLLWVQLLAAVMLTPAVVADAIADERHRGTLDHLRASPLTVRELLLGKLLGRLAGVLMVILAGWPVLSLLLVFGGVAPAVVGCGCAAVVATGFSVAGLSLLVSVHARRPRDALALSYLLLLALFLGGQALGRLDATLQRRFGADGWGVRIVAWLAEWNRAADPLVFHGRVSGQNLGGTSLDEGGPVDLTPPLSAVEGQVLVEKEESDDLIPSWLLAATLWYVGIHGLVWLLAVLLAWWKLRRLEAEDPGPRRRFRWAWRWPRPAVGIWPMLWKEVWLDPGFRLGRGGLILLTLVTVFLVGQGLLLVVQHRHLSEEIRTNDTSGEVFILYSRFALDETLEEAMRQHVGRAVELLLSLGLLTVVARAAACVGGERDKRTLESLLATPVAADHLLAAKAFGSAVSLRWVAGPVVLVWLLGWQWGGLGWGGLGYLLLITPFLAGLAAALGLIVGVAAASTSRAIIAALALALAVGGWPWLLVTQVGWKVPSLLPEAVGWALPPFVLFLAVPWYATAWALGRRWRTPLGRGAAVLIGGCGLLLALELMVRGFAAWPATLNRREEYLAHLLMPPELIADALAGVTWRVTLGSWSDRPGWLALALLCYLNAALILGTLAAALFRRTCGRIDRS